MSSPIMLLVVKYNKLTVWFSKLL